MKKLTSVLPLILLLVLVMPAYGQSTPDRQEIQLQTVTFDPIADGEPTGAGLQSDQNTPYQIVQFVGPVETAWVQQLEALGADVLGALPVHAQIVRVDPSDAEKVRQMYAVRWMGPYRAAYKLSQGVTKPSASLANANRDIVIIAHPGESLAALSTALLSQGGTLLDSADLASGPVVRVSMPIATISALAEMPAIAWIEEYSVMQKMNAEGRKLMGVNEVWQTNNFFGEGQIVAVSDTGLSVQGQLNRDFEGRLKRGIPPAELTPNCASKTNFTDFDGHGTHVAGSVLGSGANSGANLAQRQYVNSNAGSAPLAQLVFIAIDLPGTQGLDCIPLNGNYIALGYNEGARISSNSWGAAGNSQYTQNSGVVDDYVWRNKDYLVMFAAGNAGPNPRTIGAPATAKNILAIGASQNLRPDVLFRGNPESSDPSQMANFSSRGPTLDGRVKPDLVAPGTTILSVRAENASSDTVEFFNLFQPQPANPNLYAYSRGTSMATPLAAGAAAVVREWLVKARGIANPSAALMKATLINGAARMPGPVPNFNSGWGRMDVKNTITGQYSAMDDNQSGLSTGEFKEYTVSVVAAGTQGVMVDTSTLASTAQLQTTDLDTTVVASQPVTGTSTLNPASVSVETVPGYTDAVPRTPLLNASQGKVGVAPLLGPRPTNVPSNTNSNRMSVAPYNPNETNAFGYQMIYGGDFEEETWIDAQDIWLGAGLPLRTDRFGSSSDPRARVALDGDHSIWLGGSPSQDAIWYPISFPEELDNVNPNRLRFLLRMDDLDEGFDDFCVAITDAAYRIISDLKDCDDTIAVEGNTDVVTYDLTGVRDLLAGQTGYLALYIASDAELPHMSAFVDNVELSIDLPNMAAASVPSSGPPGSRFLISGQFAVPYGEVDVCVTTCANSANLLDTVAADDQGDVLAYVSTNTTIAPGAYTIQLRDVAGRTANAQLTIAGAEAAITVTPQSGPAGTVFGVTGSGFLPNETEVEVVVNGRLLGTVGSNAEGAVNFTLRTTNSTPPATYELCVRDSRGTCASATYEVTAVSAAQPRLSVAPGSAPQGTAFVFTGQNFAPSQLVSIRWEGQTGQLTPRADGGFQVTLNTTAQTPPGRYTLSAVQGERQASVEFEVTKSTNPGPDPQPSGSGLYVSLVWTDPPGQTSAARALVNDLDLVVSEEDQVYKGNAGLYAAGSNCLKANGHDQCNNVETIRIETPEVGTYKIVVRAAAVNATFGKQPYALVATSSQVRTGAGTAGFVGLNPIYIPLLRR